jgi:transcriptional regulator with XRE-family HTH domain
MANEKQLHSVKPSLNELLPTLELREAYEEASAALEAGRLVRALRKRAGLTQQALAERLSMTQARVSAIEAGEGRDGPTYGLLKRIAAACGMSLASALAGDAMPSRSTVPLEECLRALQERMPAVSSKEQLRALVRDVRALTDKVPETGAAEATDYLKKSLENDSAFIEKLLGAKSYESAVQIQTDYWKSSYAGFVAELTKLGELYSNLAKKVSSGQSHEEKLNESGKC